MKQTASQSAMAETLAQEAVNRRLVVFAGAGCSCSAQLPSWSKLLAELMLSNSIKTRESDPLRLANRLDREMGPLPFREAIADRLRLPPRDTTPLLDAIAKLPTNLFLTTNYDHVLEDRLKSEWRDVQVIREAGDLPSRNPSRRTVVKLHGDVDSPAGLVITESDYARYGEDQKDFNEFLSATMVQQTLLYVGVSFDDPRVRQADARIWARFGNRRRPPYIICVPHKDESGDDSKVAVLEADFEAYCEDLRDRGFRVVVLEEFDAVPRFLDEITRQHAQLNRSESSVRLSPLESDRLSALEGELKSKEQKECRRLISAVQGGDGTPQPSPDVALQRLPDLRTMLAAKGEKLDPELRLDAWCTVVDTLAMPEPEKLAEARKAFDGALHLLGSVAPDSPPAKRLNRVAAKLLWQEGDREGALNRLAPEDDPSDARMWLAIQLDSDDLGPALGYINSHTVDEKWAHLALQALALNGDMERATTLQKQILSSVGTGSERLKADLCIGLSSGLYRRG